MSIRIKNADFVTSLTNINAYNQINPNEFCVTGRSNVGKSSFINMLANKKIAKTSQTPGRTRLINIFSFDIISERDESGNFTLVDLPGYGYAEASKDEKAKWGKMIEGYLTGSNDLKHVFSLVDSRHAPTALDKQMIGFLYHYALPFTVIATKCDKLSKNELNKNIQTIATTLGLGRDDIVPVSQNALNKQLVLDKIGSIINDVKENID